MTCYSHSRLSTFEQCRYKYKLQYIDRVKVDVPTTIECFMGDLVHRALEKLYHDLRFSIVDSKEDILRYYNSVWADEFTDEILIAKEGLTGENYRKMGEKYISDYYDQYTPFDEMTILGLETQDRMDLPDGNQWHVRIDKLGCVGDVYYVCDYKTNSRMKTQEEADNDRQLALYSKWVSDRFNDASKVVLRWDMLAFGKAVESIRSKEELNVLISETVDLIKKVESCEDYPTNTSALCNYCVYKSICPEFKHEFIEEDLDMKEVVDEYSSIVSQEKELKKRKEELKAKLIEFAKSNDIEVVNGSTHRVKLKKYEKIVYPEDKKEFVKMLKDKGLFDEFSSVNYLKLSSALLKGEVSLDLDREVGFRVSVGKK